MSLPHFRALVRPTRDRYTDVQRELWVRNDAGAYADFKRFARGRTVPQWVRDNWQAIDDAMDSALGWTQPPKDPSMTRPPAPGKAKRTVALRTVQRHLRETGAPSWQVDKADEYPMWELVDVDTRLFGVLEAGVDEGVVRKYLRRPQATMPPVVAVPVEGTDEYEIIDGNHRALVCQLRKVKCPTWIPARRKKT
jgi:hypothetical protein